MSRIARLAEMYSGGGDSIDMMSVAWHLPEIVQKEGAKFLFGKSALASLSVDGQTMMVLSLVVMSVFAMQYNEGKAGSAGGGSTLAAYFALVVLSMLAQGDAASDLLFSRDSKSAESFRMLISVPAFTYLFASFYCAVYGNCNSQTVGRMLRSAAPLMAAAMKVGLLNAMVGSFLYDMFPAFEDDERERHLLTAKGALARLSDSVASTPGVIATLLVYRNQSRLNVFRGGDSGMGGGMTTYSMGGGNTSSALLGGDRPSAVQMFGGSMDMNGGKETGDFGV